MIVKTQSIHFDADAKLLDFIQKKMDKLETFNDRIQSADVSLKLQKDDNKGNKVVNIKILLPGDELFVTEQAESFEEATDVAYETLKRLLNKKKEKAKE